MAKGNLEFAQLRSDLVIIAQSSPKKPDRYVVKDPVSENIVELSEKEIFICQQLDGVTSLEKIEIRVREKYNVHVRSEQLRAFIHQLDEQDLLVGSDQKVKSGVHAPQGWEAMKPLPFHFGQVFTTLSAAMNRVFTTWFLKVFSLLVLAAGIIVIKSWGPISSIIWQYFIFVIEGSFPPFSSQNAFGLFLFLGVIPLVREVCKAIACRHYGGYISEVRYIWFMRFIPRFAADISAAYGMKDKNHRLIVIGSGLLCELLLGSIGIIGCELMKISDPAQSFWASFSSAWCVSFIFNFIPLGKNDGSLLFAHWIEMHGLRDRAVKTAKAWVLRQFIPEALTLKRRRLFRWYGTSSLVYEIVMNTLLFWLIGALLIMWFSGVGCILFLAVLSLRFEKEIKQYISFPQLFLWLQSYCLKSGKLKSWAIWVGAGIVFFIPYQYEVAGEFQIEPRNKRVIRAQVKGYIDSIVKGEGAQVKAGELILSLSKREILKDLNLAKAALEEAQAKSEGAKLKSDYSQREFTRAEQLYKEGQISTQDYENRQREKDIDMQEYSAKKAELQQAQTLLSYYDESLFLTDIRAPIDGQVTTPYLDHKINNRVEVGDPLVIVGDMRKVLIEVKVPEQYISEVKLGRRVHAKTLAYYGNVLVGKVIAIAPAASTEEEIALQQASVALQEKGAVQVFDTKDQKVVRVIAELANANERLKPGMTGRAKIKAGWNPLGIMLITEALRFVNVDIWSWLP